MHTPYSDPGRFGGLLAELPTDPPALAEVARKLIVHYRASGYELPVDVRDEINARWLEDILEADPSRRPVPADSTSGADHPSPRVLSRPHPCSVLGLCWPMASPLDPGCGSPGYFIDGWHHDHVIVETWLDGRWVRFDSQLDGPSSSLPTPMDIGRCKLDGTGFLTAAEAWVGSRRRQIDAATYGVGPEVPGFRGAFFLFDEVIFEVAHRFGDELLLWDGYRSSSWRTWTTPSLSTDAVWLDPISAELLIAADRGDLAAERSLLDRYRSDEGLHPGPIIRQASPYGDEPIEIPVRPCGCSPP